MVPTSVGFRSVRESDQLESPKRVYLSIPENWEELNARFATGNSE
jgi:hypothetical protein